jgi:squalene-hopene/tetraprenyl-beta-curcumene cyclase
MVSRTFCVVSLVLGLITAWQVAAALGGDLTPKQWDRTGAERYLDGREQAWFSFGSANRGQGADKTTCVSCHSLLPYALARPALRKLSNDDVPTKLESKILEQIKHRVSNWDRLDAAEFQLYYDFDDDKKKQSRGTESILNALILAFDDRFQGRPEPSSDTKKAMSILWASQIKSGPDKGSWEWLNFGLEPWESHKARYLGATLAALAVGAAPEKALKREAGDARSGLDSLREYLKKNFASQNLHNHVWLLWASVTLNGLLTPGEKDQVIEQIFAKQQDNGGWSLASLGEFARKDVTPDVKNPDGYATGLILHVLQLAGVAKENPHVSKGLAWLRENQDPAGGWRARSVNKNRSPESKNPALAHVGKFMWDAATAYSVLALSH